jgi:hypothetical protein
MSVQEIVVGSESSTVPASWIWWDYSAGVFRSAMTASLVGMLAQAVVSVSQTTLHSRNTSLRVEIY